jgi:hypothetical protein
MSFKRLGARTSQDEMNNLVISALGQCYIHLINDLLTNLSKIQSTLGVERMLSTKYNIEVTLPASFPHLQDSPQIDPPPLSGILPVANWFV